MILSPSFEPSEMQLHIAAMDWVNLHPKEARFVHHFPLEGKRNPATGHYLKRMGMKKGVSDLFIMMPRHGYPGAFIEIKTSKGRLSDSQKQFQLDAASQGYFAATTYGLDETIRTLDWYMFKCPSVGKLTSE